MLCKVINTKSVFGSKADVQTLVLPEENRKTPQFLFRVMGQITGYVQGPSKFKRTDAETGEVSEQMWTKFAGDFYAVNRDGREYESAICFLPDYVGGPMMQAIKDDQEHNAVDFAFDIYAAYSDKSATSYEFIAQPLRRDTGPSAIERMQENLPALPGATKPKQIAKAK